MPEQAKQRLLRYLADAHASETGEMTTLADVAAQSLDAEVTAALEAHHTVTQTHQDLLAQRIEALGGQTSGAKSFVDSFIAKGSNFVNAFHDDQDKQTQDLVKVYALQTFQQAMYTALQAYADSVGDADTAQLADTLRVEEEHAAQQFLALVPQLALACVNRTRDVTVNLHQQS
jgi:ferritin-like metal-binding protein YciE